MEKLRPYAELMRLHRPIGTWLLLWPTLTGLWLAGEGHPDLWLIVVFSAGVWLTRSAGCVINDIADKDLDARVTRTASRPLAQGQIPVSHALLLSAGLFLAAFVLVVAFTNALTVWWSVVALAIACAYPFVKRISHYPQLVLAIAFSWGIPMAFTAQTQAEPPAAAWLLFMANLLWTIAYDTEYAMADRAGDLQIGVKSTAIAFGRMDLALIVLLQTGFVLCLAWLAVFAQLGCLFAASLAVICALFAHQYRLIRERTPEGCLRGFQHNRWVGLALFVGIVLDNL